MHIEQFLNVAVESHLIRYWRKRTKCIIISARQHICIARICYRPSVRPSVCLSVTLVDQSKTVEVTIVQLAPQMAHDSSFPMPNLAAKFQRENREREFQIRQGYEKPAIFSQ